MEEFEGGWRLRWVGSDDVTEYDHCATACYRLRFQAAGIQSAIEIHYQRKSFPYKADRSFAINQSINQSKPTYCASTLDHSFFLGLYIDVDVFSQLIATVFEKNVCSTTTRVDGSKSGFFEGRKSRGRAFIRIIVVMITIRR